MIYNYLVIADLIDTNKLFSFYIKNSGKAHSNHLFVQ